jgi:hypothetical protein
MRHNRHNTGAAGAAVNATYQVQHQHRPGTRGTTLNATSQPQNRHEAGTTPAAMPVRAHLAVVASKHGWATITRKLLFTSGLEHVTYEIRSHRVHCGIRLYEHACPGMLVHKRHFAICTTFLFMKNTLLSAQCAVMNGTLLSALTAAADQPELDKRSAPKPYHSLDTY